MVFRVKALILFVRLITGVSSVLMFISEVIMIRLSAFSFLRHLVFMSVRPSCLVMASAGGGKAAPSSAVGRRVIRPLAMLDVVQRRGRSWGLLASYEESRLSDLLPQKSAVQKQA